jgi:short-subunit dehydrogenase
MENNTVTLTLERYDELKECEIAYEKMQLSIALLINNAELDYNKKDLRFENEDMRDLVKIFDSNFYYERVKELKEKE